jgi:hypothetical protein
MEEVKAANPFLTQLATGYRSLQIETDKIEFPMEEIQVQMNIVSHLNILVSQMPIHILQILQIGIFHEIELCADEEKWEMTKLMDEGTQWKQKYSTSLQKKSELKGRVEETMKDKNEAEERARKSLKEKDKASIMA